MVTKVTDVIIDRAFETVGLQPTGKEHTFIGKNGFTIWYFYRSSTSDPWAHSYNKITIRYEAFGRWQDKNIFLKNITTTRVVNALKEHAGAYLRFSI